MAAARGPAGPRPGPGPAPAPAPAPAPPGSLALQEGGRAVRRAAGRALIGPRGRSRRRRLPPPRAHWLRRGRGGGVPAGFKGAAAGPRPGGRRSSAGGAAAEPGPVSGAGRRDPPGPGACRQPEQEETERYPRRKVTQRLEIINKVRRAPVQMCSGTGTGTGLPPPPREKTVVAPGLRLQKKSPEQFLIFISLWEQRE